MNHYIINYIRAGMEPPGKSPENIQHNGIDTYGTPWICTLHVWTTIYSEHCYYVHCASGSHVHYGVKVIIQVYSSNVQHVTP